MNPMTVDGFQRWLWVLWGVTLVCSLLYARRYPIRRSFGWFFACAFLILPVAVNLSQRSLIYVEVMVAAVFVYGLYLLFKPYRGDPNTPQ